MAKRTESRKCVAPKATLEVNGATLRRAVNWAVDARIFAHLRFHGNTSWRALDLVVLAVVWVWSGHARLTGAFTEAHRWSTRVLGRAAVDSFQGLLKALVRWTTPLLPLLVEQLHRLMEEHGGRHWRVGRWLALAVDGSRVSVARTRDNEKAFCAPNYGKGKTAKYRKKNSQGQRASRKRPEKMQPVKPQIWVTLLWHLGLQMPWSWRSGPSYASERDHWREMIARQSFPENTLFCGDAGFVGYDVWKAVGDAGHAFLVRVGANVKLLRGLGYVREHAGVVYCWPNRAARAQLPPLVLRLLRVRVGRCVMHLLTNVLDARHLTAQDAAQLYQLRWGVELQFRTIKQTFGRRKLRSRSPERALVELDWSLLGLWLIQLFAVREQVEIGEVPEHCSVALAIQVIRDTVQHYSERPERAFREQLRSATKDRYQRTKPKQGRYRPKYKDRPKAGSPAIRVATAGHKALLQRYLKTVA